MPNPDALQRRFTPRAYGRRVIGSGTGWREAAMSDGARSWRIRPSWVVLGVLGALGLIVLGFPLATLLYLGVLLLCPLMMVGMHAGHGVTMRLRTATGTTPRATAGAGRLTTASRRGGDEDVAGSSAGLAATGLVVLVTAAVVAATASTRPSVDRVGSTSFSHARWRPTG
jgi:hypothetical protein